MTQQTETRELSLDEIQAISGGEVDELIAEYNVTIAVTHCVAVAVETMASAMTAVAQHLP